MTISRNPSLTEQVKAHLKERILNGDFDEGRIPPETELAADLGVSRTTVRDALSRLENEGTIYRKQGAGTFVNEPGLQIKSRLEEIWSYEAVLEAHGYTPTVEVLDLGATTADPHVATALGLESGDPVLAIHKLFLEDDEPVVLTVNHIPLRLVVGDPAVSDGTLPIYEFLEVHCDRQLSYYLSEIVPVALDAQAASLLGETAGVPAVSFEETGFDRDNEPVVKSTSFFRDDLLRFRLIRRRAGA